MDSIINSSYLKFDQLSIFVGIFIGFFSLVTAIYSIGFMRGRKNLGLYYFYLVLTLITSLGAVFSNHFVLFIVCWGFLGLMLYLLIGYGQKERTTATAKKALIIVGGSDALMILGLAIVWRLTGSFRMEGDILFDSSLAVLAYICLAAGAFAKAGAMPLHTWIPDTAEDAPTPVTAFLPASLDKLLGIYFLARISLDLFQMNDAVNTFLMVIGSVTIVAAVMMALVQHDLKRLLGYHAVSQVGYMVLGIGTGNPIGIAGGLFHMLNHAIYKSCLFLSSGAVEKKAGTTDLEKLGGFAKIMPVTFAAFLIASFAISGVPPFNGFASKWMVYQGIIETGKQGGCLWILWLIAAMFGSALTLASFMKLIHAVFLGQPSKENKIVASGKLQETGITMSVPIMVLALLCVIFGVFAYSVPLKLWILPSVGDDVIFSGIWSSGLATILIVIGIVIGLLVYLLGFGTKTRQTEVFVGGENLKDFADMRLSGTEFYNTVQDFGFLKSIYRLADKKVFDVYEVKSKFVLGCYKMLSFLHNGVLPTYLSWALLGAAILFYILLK